MHSRLDGDNNAFYESDTPVRLLGGDCRFTEGRCPESLRENFVVLSPQCPIDKERADGGIWLRHGWYEASTYAYEVEESLAALLRAATSAYNIDAQRISITGASMGAYAALELAARWPGTFAAVVPVAAHYDLDPIEPLALHLTAQSLPLWFFHAKNDTMCPFETVDELVRRLRRTATVQILLTSFEDDWSCSGHCSDRVPYWKKCPGDKHEACGEELFAWLVKQRGAGREPPRFSAGSQLPQASSMPNGLMSDSHVVQKARSQWKSQLVASSGPAKAHNFQEREGQTR